MRSSLSLLFALFLAGCGYSFHSIDPSLSTLYVSKVKNKVTISSDYSATDDIKKYYPNLEVYLRQKIIDRFIFEGQLSLVNSDSADIVIDADLVNYLKEPLTYNSSEEITRWRIKIGLNVRIKIKGKEIIKSIYGEYTYDPSLISERLAIDKAMEDLAKNLADIVLNTW